MKRRPFSATLTRAGSELVKGREVSGNCLLDCCHQHITGLRFGALYNNDRRGLLFRVDAEGVRVDALVEAELSQVYYPFSRKGSALGVNC